MRASQPSQQVVDGVTRLGAAVGGAGVLGGVGGFLYAACARTFGRTVSYGEAMAYGSGLAGLGMLAFLVMAGLPSG
jgi:hypothetical protein